MLGRLQSRCGLSDSQITALCALATQSSYDEAAAG